MKGQKIRPRAAGAPARRPLMVFLFGLPTSGCHQSTPANADTKAVGLFAKASATQRSSEAGGRIT